MGCGDSKSVSTSNSKPQTKAATSSSPKGKSSTEKCERGPIKFTHFGDGGRCEPLLMIFAYAGIPFENDIIDPKDWPELKPKTKMGTLPIMTVGSEELVSSLAILGYLGGEAGLIGKTAEDQAEIHTMVNVIEDCRSAGLFLNRFMLLTNSMDEETHKAKAKEFTEGPLTKLSEYLESHICGSTWLFDMLSVADFWLYGTMKAITDVFVPDAWSTMGPKVQKWKTNFENMPQLKDYKNGCSKMPMKLTYFDARGRCEPYRMIFAHSGLDCEEVKVSFDDWGDYKKETPMGYLPVLEVGDTKITSSLPVLKCIGRECGLHGECEEAECDTLLYGIEDCRSALFPSRFLIRSDKMDDETKAEKEKEFCDKNLPQLKNCLEKTMTGDKWLLKQLSVADFWLYGTMEVLEDSLVPDIWSKMAPRVQTWRTEFESLPKVKAYMDSRPKEYKL